jgi:hypothetical protein
MHPELAALLLDYHQEAVAAVDRLGQALNDEAPAPIWTVSRSKPRPY